MKTANIMKVVCAAGLTVACTWGLAGCTSGNSSGTGGVAATVNGTEIQEDKVTSMIESIRTQSQLDTEDAWGKWLAENSMTPESVREEMIDSFVQEELVKQGAKEKNVTVESSEIDTIVDQMKGNFESDETWQQALTQAGFTEDEYRTRIESQLIQNKLMESFTVNEEPSQEDLLQYAQMYASAYTGAKRSSHILFDAADEANAQSVLEQINSGSLDFAEAAKQYSKDTGSAEKGGDVGWDKLNSFVTEYTDALTGLEKDQVSGLVKSTYGFHVIKCTDVFTAPEQVTSTDQIPVEFLDTIKSSLSQQKQQEAYQAWFTEFEEKADININTMPQGLPYVVDMSKYPAPATDESATTDGSTSGDTAAAPEGTNTEAPATEGDTKGETTMDNGAVSEGSENTSEQPKAEGEASK